MNLKLPALTTLLTVMVALLAACGDGATATPQPPPTLTSAQLGEAYETALASGELAAFTEILADDFVFTQVPGPDGSEMLTVAGRSAFMVRLAGQIENNTEFTSTDLISKGGRSAGRFSLTADNLRAIGIEALTGAFEITARDGKLTNLDTVLDTGSLETLNVATSPPAPRELTVNVGAGQDTLSINAFLPSKITVRAGDTVTWALSHPGEPHTVTFLSGGSLVPLAVPIPGGAPNEFMTNTQGGIPTRRPGALVELHYGKGYFNSGFLNNRAEGPPGTPPNDSFSLIFQTPGTYEYRCLLHPQGKGIVTVLPADTSDVPSQTYVDAKAKEETSILVAQAERLKEGLTEVRSEPGPGGSTMWHVRAGGTAFDPRAELFEFLPKELTIQEGDTVIWSSISPTIHTVTFHAGLPEPLIVFAEFRDGGRAMLTPNPEVMFPFKPAGEFEGAGLWGSGLMNTRGAAGGNAFTMTFNKAGVFDYKCLVHNDLGMEGTVTVVPRERR